MGSQLITWSFAFFLTIFLPRYIGPAGIGQYALALSIWIVLEQFMEFGTTKFMTKEIARFPEKTSKLVSAAIIIRAVLFVISCIALSTYLYVMHYPIETVYVILILGFFVPIGQLSRAISAALVGLEIMEYISLADVIGKAIQLIVVFIIMWLGLGIYAVAVTAGLVEVTSFIVHFVALRRRFPIHIRVDKSLVIWMFKSSLPFVLSGLVLTIYQEIDMIIMSALVNEVVMGWYSVAVRLSATFLFVPTILATAVFPAFARVHKDASDETVDGTIKLLSKSTDLMFLFGIPIGFGLASIANQLAVFFFGEEFAQAGPVLALMGFVMVFIYLTAIFGQYIIATDRVNIWTSFMVVATLVTIPLDLLMIPWFQQEFGNGAIGGAFAFMITELGMAIGGLLLLPRGTLTWSSVRIATLSLVAGVTMMGACWLVRDMILVVPVIVGAATYSSIILLLRVIPREDIIVLRNLSQDLVARLRARIAKPSTGEV